MKPPSLTTARQVAPLYRFFIKSGSIPFPREAILIFLVFSAFLRVLRASALKKNIRFASTCRIWLQLLRFTRTSRRISAL